MTPARKKRLALVVLMLLGVGLAATFALNAFNKNILYFFSPSQIASGEAPVDQLFRVGGMVVDGSVNRSQEGLDVAFELSDTQHQVNVVYTGILPDLFREGRVLWRSASSIRKGCSRLKPCLQSMTRTTCHPRLLMR